MNPETATQEPSFSSLKKDIGLFILKLGLLLVAASAIISGATGALSTYLAADSAPLGTILAFAAATPPPGWQVCDGRLLRSIDYPKLYVVIGTSWGKGEQDSDSSTDFNLPDLRGVFLRGVNAGRKDGYRDPDTHLRKDYAGNSVASEGELRVGSYQEDDIAEHDHKVLGYTKAQLMNGATEALTIAAAAQNADSGPKGGSETRPRNASVLFIIKVE